jgi:hypothetical protein
MVDGIREDLDVQQALEREVSEVALHKGPMEITEENIEKATSEGKRRVSRRSEEDSDESAA